MLADVDGDDNGRLEIVAAAMDRHVYAWNHDGSEVQGFPVLLVDESKVAAIDNRTHRITFKPDAGSQQQGAIVATPAVADLDGDADENGEDELPEIVVGTNEEYSAGAGEVFNAGAANGASVNLLDQAGTAINAVLDQCGSDCPDNPLPLEPGNTRLYAFSSEGDRDGNPAPANALRPGWPTSLGIVLTGLLPVVGEGVTGSPVVAPASCTPGGEAAPRVGAAANNGPGYILDEDGDSCYGQDPQGRDIPLQTDVSASAGYDRPFLPAVGLPAFGDLGEGSPSFLLPAAGLMRALDLALPEYQRSQDYIGAWSVQGGGQFRPNYPATMNDLQFLTGPAVADIDGLPGEEVIEGSASKDFAAYNAAGVPVDDDWPKLTTDWTVATPLIGSFGTLDTDGDARKVVVNMTRSGYINVYETEAEACSPSSSPRFHHDNANSGDYSRDAVLPGKPTGAAVAAGEVSFEAPGDDLLCGTADSYELVTSDQPIDESSFGDADPLALTLAPDEAGTAQSFEVPAGAERYLALRAVDEQGNVGRVASVDLGPGGGPGPTDPTDPDAPADPADPADPGAGDSPPGELPSAGPCSNRVEGSSRADRLTGTEGADRLRGFRGNDLIKALGGDDCVVGGLGRDRIKCGPGEDEAIVDRRDTVKGCERVRKT